MGERGVLFDADGVLLDSMTFHRTYWTRYAALRDLSFDVVWEATIGRRWSDTVRIVSPDLDVGTEVAVIAEMCGEGWREISLFPGVAVLLRSLPSSSWGIVSSARGWEIGQVLARYGITAPRVLVGGERVAVGKPDPEGYLKGAEELGIAPANVLVVEDAPDGIAAARAAGMFVIGVTTSLDAGLLDGAHLIRSSLIEARADIDQWLAAP